MTLWYLSLQSIFLNFPTADSPNLFSFPFKSSSLNPPFLMKMEIVNKSLEDCIARFKKLPPHLRLRLI